VRRLLFAAVSLVAATSATAQQSPPRLLVMDLSYARVWEGTVRAFGEQVLARAADGVIETTRAERAPLPDEAGVERVAERVHERMDLGAQAAAAAPDRLVAAPFLTAPALCWWARTTVLSIIAYSLSASPARCSKTRFQTPPLAQRPKRVWTFFQAPNRSGRSRQGIPAR
jgi:hypothetical protein